MVQLSNRYSKSLIGNHQLQVLTPLWIFIPTSERVKYLSTNHHSIYWPSPTAHRAIDDYPIAPRHPPTSHSVPITHHQTIHYTVPSTTHYSSICNLFLTHSLHLSPTTHLSGTQQPSHSLPITYQLTTNSLHLSSTTHLPLTHSPTEY